MNKLLGRQTKKTSLSAFLQIHGLASGTAGMQELCFQVPSPSFVLEQTDFLRPATGCQPSRTSISWATPARRCSPRAEKSWEALIGPAEVTDQAPTNHHGQQDWPDLYNKFPLAAGDPGANREEGSRKEEGGGQDRQEQ